MSQAEDQPVKQPPLGLVLGTGEERLWGMTSEERLRRSLARAGIDEVRFEPAAAEPPACPQAPPGRGVVVLRADWVFDHALVQDLAASPDTVLVEPETGVAVGAHVPGSGLQDVLPALTGPGALPPAVKRVDPAELSGAYNNKLRKREAPYLLRLTRENLPAIERRMFAGSYKGVTDVVTKHVWPAPALKVTKWCAERGFTPNQVTWVSFALVLLAFVLFWNDQFIAGLLAAWGMTFLDTVDGKLARVTLTSSRFGDVFDHGIDLVHPPFWWWAWIVGLHSEGQPLSAAGMVLAIVVLGYIAQRLQEGLFLALFKIEIHIWRRFDSWFRLITARRNPNLILLTVATLMHEPDLGMVAVAAWTLICFGVHAAQIVQGVIAARRGPIESWLAR